MSEPIKIGASRPLASDKTLWDTRTELEQYFGYVVRNYSKDATAKGKTISFGPVVYEEMDFDGERHLVWTVDVHGNYLTHGPDLA